MTTFGSLPEGVVARARSAAYAVVFSAEGRVATIRAEVRGRTWCWLIGGGAEPGETPEETVVREAREEVGRPLRVGRRIHEARQFFYAGDEECWYDMQAVFLSAEFSGEAAGGESEVHWLDPVEASAECFHACHAWIIGRAAAGRIG